MKNLKQWIIDNPIGVLFLGICPALAATVDVRTGLIMGVSIIAVMLLVGIVTALLKSVMTSWISRLFVNLFVGLSVQMLVHALFPTLYGSVGVYFGILAVSFCGIGASETAMKKSFGATVKYAVLGGASATVALFVASLIREVLGKGSFAGIEIGFMSDFTIPLLQSAPGAFLAVAIVVAIMQAISGSDGVKAEKLLLGVFSEEE